MAVEDSNHEGEALCCAQVSGDSVDDYKQTIREGLRRMLDAPVDALGTSVEWVVAYVKPATIDPLAKGPGKVRCGARVWTPQGPDCWTPGPALGTGAFLSEGVPGRGLSSSRHITQQGAFQGLANGVGRLCSASLGTVRPMVVLRARPGAGLRAAAQRLQHAAARALRAGGLHGGAGHGGG